MPTNKERALLRDAQIAEMLELIKQIHAALGLDKEKEGK